MYENLILVVDGVTASRTPVYGAAVGLSPELLLDLTWADPSYGYTGMAWWPEEIIPQTLPHNSKWGIEIFTIISDRKVVQVEKEIIPLTQEEIDTRDNAIKSEILVRVAARRYQAELLNCTWDGNVIPLDDRSKLVLVDLRGEALVNSNYTAVYKVNGGFVTLSNADILDLASTVRKYIQDCYDREFALYTHVQNWTYEESMLDQGWPSAT